MVQTHEIWNVSIAFHAEKYTPSIHFNLDVADSSRSKEIVLEAVKKRLCRHKLSKDRSVSIMAAPKIEGGLDGDRMLRNRFRYSTKNLLRMRDPEKVFVTGYGPKQWDDLQGYSKSS